MDPEARSTFAELMARTGDSKRALERESERLADIARVADHLVTRLDADPVGRAVAEQIARVAQEQQAITGVAAARLDSDAFDPALHELIREDLAATPHRPSA